MRVSKRKIYVFVAMLVTIVSTALAREIMFSLPTTYTDNTAIDCTAYVASVWYYGPTSDGPWTDLGSAGPGEVTWIGSIPCDNNTVTGGTVDNCWVTGVAVDNSCVFAPAFDNATTYPVNRAVVLDNVCYMSAVDNNVGDTPPSDLWVSVSFGNTSSKTPTIDVPRFRRSWSPFALQRGTP